MTNTPHRLNFRQRLVAWLALCAVWWVGLLPTLSHAVLPADSAGGAWVQVCSASGMRWIRFDATAQAVSDGTQAFDASSSAPDDSSGTALSTPACDWCAAQAAHTPCPPPNSAGLPAPLLGHERPAAFWHAPHLLPVWASAQSRAPPLSA